MPKLAATVVPASIRSQPAAVVWSALDVDKGADGLNEQMRLDRRQRVLASPS
jgi:hypothetical protein